MYVVNILMVASKKAITRAWGGREFLTVEQWLEIEEEMFKMKNPQSSHLCLTGCHCGRADWPP